MRPSLSPNQDRFIRISLLTGLAVLLAGLVVPIPIRAVTEVTILGASVLAAVDGLRREQRFRIARIAFLLLFVLYAALLLHPNLPDLRTGLEGIRYTLVALAGLFVGLALPDREGRPRMIPAITGVLLIGATVSLAVHLIDPSFEQSLKRSADIATGMLGGQIRMQGLLSGPFHAAMLGAFLTLSGVWCLIRRSLWGVPLLVIGELVLLLARVRTGLITVLLGLIVLAVLGWRMRNRDQPVSRPAPINRLAPILTIPLLLAVGFGAGFVEGNGSANLVGESSSSGSSDNAAVSGLGSLPGDHRTGNRLKSMRSALDSTVNSPIIGRGPGSAASGLEAGFLDAGKVHEQPHDGPLGVAVEVGLVGLVAFLFLIGSVLANLTRALWAGRRPAEAGIASAAIFSLGFFFLTGDALGALPVSLSMLLLTGVYLANLQNGSGSHSEA